MTDSSPSTKCKIKQFLKKICKIRIKSDYKLDLSFYRDAEEKQPYSTYTTSGSSKFNAVKLIGVISSILLVATLISAIDNCRNK